MLNLTARLLLAAGRLGLNPHTLLHAYQQALACCLACLTAPTFPPRVPLAWADTTAPLALVRSVLGAKHVARLRPMERDYLATLVLSAFVSSLAQEGDAVGGHTVMMFFERKNVVMRALRVVRALFCVGYCNTELTGDPLASCCRRCGCTGQWAGT
jgi:hypothetical protein